MIAQTGFGYGCRSDKTLGDAVHQKLAPGGLEKFRCHLRRGALDPAQLVAATRGRHRRRYDKPNLCSKTLAETRIS
jgi:hypothetical protein